MWRDIKYLIAYILPLSAFVGVLLGGWWSGGAVYVAFVVLPMIEETIPMSSLNLSPDAETTRERWRLFDVLLYLNVPMLFALGVVFLNRITAQGTDSVTTLEALGMMFSVGVVFGAAGINVAHELGHRETWFERLLAKMLLLPNLYLHFIIEHNRGHHKHVATDADPASARYGENIYAFWWRSVTGSYVSAWRLEAERLKREAKPIISHHNEMIGFTAVELAFLLAIAAVWGFVAMFWAVGCAVVGFLLLELVNYIEHYGLRRELMPSGRYEKVLPRHSWNSNHELGRIFLYELTRHSDHHYKATRKYQVLRHFDESPQLPHGYPASMLLALVPPLWFRRMNPEVQQLATATE